MRSTILIKPHHFVDIMVSFGRGERTFHPHPYGHAVHTVSERILKDREVCLTITLGVDDICRPCIHNVHGVCDDTIDTSYRPTSPPLKKDYMLLSDQRWCERLMIGEGDSLTARGLCERILDRMGDITDIYREIPPDMTATRYAELVKGLEYYLNQK